MESIEPVGLKLCNMLLLSRDLSESVLLTEMSRRETITREQYGFFKGTK